MHGLRISKYVTPEAFKAVISLSDDNLPKAINVVINVAIGTASENIQAEFRNKNFITTLNEIPFPRNLSIFFKIKLERRTNININRELKKGMVSSFKMYLCKIFNLKECN